MSNQLDFISDIIHFDGKTYEPIKDYKRLTTQLGKTFNLMKDGEWRTIPEIAYKVGGSQASISARLRDFRKEKFGSHTVERKRVEGGLYKYRLITNDN